MASHAQPLPAPSCSTVPRNRPRWPAAAALVLLLALGAGASLPLKGDITVASIFTDHAVLQRSRPVPIWGTAAPHEAVTVSFRGRTVRTQADAAGRWVAVLPALPTESAGADLVVTGQTTVRRHDIVVGEVWLMSGQSNIEWPVERVRDAAQEMAAAHFPLLRQVKIERSVATAPASDVPTGGWKPATPSTVGSFSGVGYFFGRALYQQLGVPIGLINSTYGGTAIESWMSDAARRATPLAATLDARWRQEMSEWPPDRVARYPADMARWNAAQAEADAAHTKNPLPWPQPPATRDSPSLPGGLYNGMIAPLVPFALRGTVWYQGESNVGRSGEYAELFTALIESWRHAWRNPEMPFYFVQLPNYADGKPQGTAWARQREAQAQALRLPNTGMAVAIDVGDADNLHPPYKQEVGRRLALLALAGVYGRHEAAEGPVFAGADLAGGALRVRFRNADSGLIARGGHVQALEVAGADRVFQPAVARIKQDTLIVSSPAVPHPVAVRYAWTNAPEANLTNAAGLPAAPFRSDNW